MKVGWEVQENRILEAEEKGKLIQIKVINEITNELIDMETDTFDNLIEWLFKNEYLID
jgi:regulator of RNase E activity RraB